MKKIYRIAATAVLASGIMTANAESFHRIRVFLNDDTKVEMMLSYDFDASFTDTDLVLTDGTESVSVPRAKLASFEFVNDLDSVDEIVAEPMIDGSRMSFTDLPSGTAVNIFSTDGKTIAAYNVSGDWTLDFSTLPAGVCVVNINGVSYKINVK